MGDKSQYAFLALDASSVRGGSTELLLFQLDTMSNPLRMPSTRGPAAVPVSSWQPQKMEIITP